MPKTFVEEFVADPKHMRLFQQERAIYEVTELLESLMRQSGVSRADLAKRLGKTKGWVTQLLDGEANKTIKTVADAFAVLGHEYHSHSEPIQISRGSGVTIEATVSSANVGNQPLFRPGTTHSRQASARLLTHAKVSDLVMAQ